MLHLFPEQSTICPKVMCFCVGTNVVSEREKKFTTYAPSYVPDHIFYFLFKLNSTTDGIRLAPISAYCTFLSLGIPSARASPRGGVPCAGIVPIGFALSALGGRPVSQSEG